MSRAKRVGRRSSKGSVLALFGGPKAITLPTERALRWPITGRPEVDAVTRLVRRGELSISAETRKLEEEFAHFIGVRYVLAHTNGTAAGHAAFFALGIGPGDEVICPSFTYWASIVQVLTLGGVPVFCEVDPDTLNADPADIERKITPRTKAIVVVHMLGMPCEMREIRRLARRHGLKVIEDASHAHGARYRGRMVGSLGEVSFFSLQSSKLMVGGEGGLFCTNRREYYRRAVALGHYERIGSLGRRDTVSFDLSTASEAPERARGASGTCREPEATKLPWSRLALTGFGFKYRIHPLAAAIARVQLRRLPTTNARKKRNGERFLTALAPMRSWHIAPVPKHIDRVYYENWIRFNPEAAAGVTKERVIEALRAEGAAVYDARYSLLHRQPLFQEPEHYRRDGAFPVFEQVKRKPIYPKDLCPVSEAVRATLVGVPTFPRASKALVDQYVRAFRKVDEHLEELRSGGP